MKLAEKIAFPGLLCVYSLSGNNTVQNRIDNRSVLAFRTLLTSCSLRLAALCLLVACHCSNVEPLFEKYCPLK